MPEKIFILVAGYPFFDRLFELELEPQILAQSSIHLPKVGHARINASCATSTVAAPLASSCPVVISRSSDKGFSKAYTASAEPSAEIKFWSGTRRRVSAAPSPGCTSRRRIVRSSLR